MLGKKKLSGVVYTPHHIVKNILDLLGYNKNIVKKHIIDNSCGEGAFLLEVAKRYIKDYFRQNSDKNELASQLGIYIHGIDSDKGAIDICLNNLNNLIKTYALPEVNWDIHSGNTLEIDNFDNKMDYVVGNPPYVRVHNLKDSYKKVKEFSFAGNGMTDLYIVFFEIGLIMLNENGKMGLITPSSFLRSLAGKNLRKYIYDSKSLKRVVDLGHYQPFEAATYTMITIFDKSYHGDSIQYSIYDENTLKPQKIEDLSYKDIFINKKIYFSPSDKLSLLHNIEHHFANRSQRDIVVKNGFATLADKVFIGDFDFDNLVIDVLKASTGKWYKCLFPYDEMGNPLSLSDIEKYPEIYNYFLKNKDILKKKSSENPNLWYLFGRSQGIKDVFLNKVAVNTVIKDKNSLKIQFVPAGKGVYSGLYVVSPFDVNQIKEVLETDEFIDYLRVLKNYKNSGYYSLSSSELEKYLSYKLEKNMNN